GTDFTPYPTAADNAAMAAQGTPAYSLVISDAAGHPIRVLGVPARAGLGRISWDLRLLASPTGGGRGRGGAAAAPPAGGRGGRRGAGGAARGRRHAGRAGAAGPVFGGTLSALGWKMDRAGRARERDGGRRPGEHAAAGGDAGARGLPRQAGQIAGGGERGDRVRRADFDRADDAARDGGGAAGEPPGAGGCHGCG